MLKILQTRLQHYMIQELPDVQAGFRKGRGTKDQIANIRWTIKKAREFQKNIYFCFIDYAKSFILQIKTNWKILRDETTRPPYLPPENLYAVQEATVRTRHGTHTGCNLCKEYVKAVYCLTAYVIYMQSTSWEKTGCMKDKLESRFHLLYLSIYLSIYIYINNLRYAGDTTLMAKTKEVLKSLLMK